MSVPTIVVAVISPVTVAEEPTLRVGEFEGVYNFTGPLSLGAVVPTTCVAAGDGVMVVEEGIIPLVFFFIPSAFTFVD